MMAQELQSATIQICDAVKFVECGILPNLDYERLSSTEKALADELGTLSQSLKMILSPALKLAYELEGQKAA